MFVAFSTINQLTVDISALRVVSENGGSPRSLDGSFHGKSICKWMMTWGIPILANLQINGWQPG